MGVSDYPKVLSCGLDPEFWAMAKERPALLEPMVKQFQSLADPEVEYRIVKIREYDRHRNDFVGRIDLVPTCYYGARWRKL